MMRQFVLFSLFTFIVCIVCLKKGNELKTIYQKWMSTTTWRRVEVLDKKSKLEELRDYGWEYLEVLAVGWTACIVSFAIGWCASCISKGYSEFRDGDTLRECLGEHWVLLGRMQELEERIKEFEPISGQRVLSKKVSNTDFGGGECIRTKDELKLSESKTMNKACQSDYNGSCCVMINSAKHLTPCLSVVGPSRTHQDPPTYEDIEEDGEKNTYLKSTTLETEIGKGAVFTGEIKADSSDKKGNEQMCKDILETDLRIGQNKLVDGDRTVQSYDKSADHPKELSDLCRPKQTSSTGTDNISQGPKEIMVVDNDTDGCTSQNEKSNVVEGRVDETVQTNPNNTARYTRMETLEVTKSEQGDSYLSLCIPPNEGNHGNLCWYTETENYLEENSRPLSKPEVDGNTRTFCEDNLETDFSNRKNVSSKKDDRRMEADKCSKLDVCQSTMTVIDALSPELSSVRSADWRDSSSRTNTRGRIIPQYQKLHKDVKVDPRSTTFHEKDNKNTGGTTTAHQNIDELSTNVSSSPTQKQCFPQRQSRPNTPSGETLYSTVGQRKRKPKQNSQILSFKEDSNQS